MNNTQLYLAIGLPVFVNLCTMTVVITAQVLFRARVNRLCVKIDSMCELTTGQQTARWSPVIGGTK